LRRLVQRWVDRAFFRVQYNYRETERQFVEEINRCVNARELGEMLVWQIEEILPVERIGFLTLELPGPRLHLLAHHNLGKLQTYGVHLETEWLKNLSQLPLALEGNLEPGVPFERGDPETARRWGIALVFPVLSKDLEILGFLGHMLKYILQVMPQPQVEEQMLSI
jgi:hypothetical protein